MNRFSRNVLAITLSAATVFLGFAQERQPLEELPDLGLKKLDGRIVTYHSEGARERAERSQADLEAMAAFYEDRLGIRGPVILGVLNPSDWEKVHRLPYGLPGINGLRMPTEIYMPATPGGFAFQRLMALRGETISEEELRTYTDSTGDTFEDLVNRFVDQLMLHELGHELTYLYGIDTRSRWLNEFLATYLAYAFLSERRPEGERVFHLFGRQPQVRPQNTTLEDFETLYNLVDDFGWYQLTFNEHVQEIYARFGLKFVTDVRRAFPRRPRAEALSPSRVLQRLEKFAPGFVAWGERFDK